VTWNGPCGTLMTSVSSVGGTSCSFARLIYTSQECPPSQPLRLIAARIRLMTSRCRGHLAASAALHLEQKRPKQCLWKFLNIFTKIRFITTPNSSLDSAWIAVQESKTLVTVRNQLSRIFDTEHGDTLSPHAQTFKVFRMHNRTVKGRGCWDPIYNTMRPGPIRPASLRSGIVIHPGPRRTSVPNVMLIMQSFGHNRHGPRIIWTQAKPMPLNFESGGLLSPFPWGSCVPI